mgnify:CR=1 FL=1
MPKKYYTVWKGIVPGVYDNWKDCHKQTVNFKGALFKSFHSEKEAKNALKFSYSDYQNSKNQSILPKEIISKSIAVDAASSGNPGVMEYQGVDTLSKKLLFKTGVDSISKCFEDIVLQLVKCGLECNSSVNKKPICSFEDIKTNESSYSNCGGLMAHNLFVKNCAKPNEALIFTPAITTPKIITKVKNSTIILKLESY